MKDFKDRVAVVTGAAGGIGLAMVECFLDAGMKVVLADIDEVKLNDTLQRLKDSGGKVHGVATDVSKAEEVEALAQRTLDVFGAVHVLCNNAGVGYGGRAIWEIPLEGWRWTLGVNLMGVIHGLHYFMPIMLAQGTEGHVVNTASVAGLLSNTITVPYGVSKHAVVALSESLHLELLNQNAAIKVSVLCPGAVNTDIMNTSENNRPDYLPPPPELTPEEDLFKRAYEIWLQRGNDPREIAAAVADAIREERFYVVSPGFNNYIEQRLQNILNARNPQPLEPPQDMLAIFEELGVPMDMDSE